jgi:hypothetical protein
MGILLRLLGSSFGPWILLVVAVTLVGTHGWAHHAGTVGERNASAARELKAITAAVALESRRHKAELAARDEQNAREWKESADIRSGLEQRLAELAALPPRTLIKTVQVPNEQGCNCDVTSLGPSFWLRFRAAGTDRGAADPQAPDSL